MRCSAGLRIGATTSLGVVGLACRGLPMAWPACCPQAQVVWVVGQAVDVIDLGCDVDADARDPDLAAALCCPEAGGSGVAPGARP